MAGAPKGAFVVISKISHSDISCIIKNSPAFARPYRKPPQKIRGAIISILPVSLYRFKDVLFNYIAYRINRRFVKFFFGKNLGQTCKTEPAIPLHTCLPFMAGAPQGAYVVILGISLGNILYITKTLGTAIIPRVSFWSG